MVIINQVSTRHDITVTTIKAASAATVELFGNFLLMHFNRINHRQRRLTHRYQDNLPVKLTTLRWSQYDVGGWSNDLARKSGITESILALHQQ